ncbi:MAG: hypothetical protein KGO48_00560 [Alphaproteobacteria bacterium]|nr:hypothetical protein [Alphaproteobacteria bacterium]
MSDHSSPANWALRASVIAAGIAGLALSSGPVRAAGSDSPPDFAPNPGVGWVASPGPFMPPPSGPGPVPAINGRGSGNAAFIARGAQPMFDMGDPDAPILQPWARELVRKRNEDIMAGKPGFTRQASCWPNGTPAFLLYPQQPVYFVQTPKEVVMTWQGDHQFRYVYMNTPHSANPKPSWYGESVGHYEGDTLVVDTIGISERTLVDNFGTPHTAQLHTIERFRMTNNGLQMEVDLHVEDPGTFTTAWDAMQRYRRVEPGVAELPRRADDFLTAAGNPGPMLESSCAENPHGLFDAPGTLPIPQADKPDF